MAITNSNYRSKGRQKFLPIVVPKKVPSAGDIDRDEWINHTCENFVSPSTANKSYYRVVLETLWPIGHGIPGPHIKSEQIREAIDQFRKSMNKGRYHDPFRRVRELQGEEGVIGITKEGNTYQLVDLKISDKRIPRVNLANDNWESILERYKHKCAVCGRNDLEIKFDQDHKIPRVRGGHDQITNWQPLCGECNNFKSTACRGCTLDCNKCCWAFPEKYAPLRIEPKNIEIIRSFALSHGMDPHTMVNEIIVKFLK